MNNQSKRCLERHVHSSINDFCERIRAITNASFVVGHFYNFLRITVAVYFTFFESIIVYKSTRRACCLPEKAKNIHVWEFSAVTFVKAYNGCVSAIPTYRVYRL